MRHTGVFSSGVVALLVAAPAAERQEPAKPGQQQLFARMECPKLDPTALSASAIKCTYSSGEIAGEAIEREEDVFSSDMYRGTSDGVSTAISDGGDPRHYMRLGRGRDRHVGTGVITLANGDTVKIQFRGIANFDDDYKPSNGLGTWVFAGGTGKAKGIKGSGKYTGKFEPDGSATWEILGKYTLSDKK